MIIENFIFPEPTFINFKKRKTNYNTQDGD